MDPPYQVQKFQLKLMDLFTNLLMLLWQHFGMPLVLHTLALFIMPASFMSISFFE